jgi:MFS family permease
MRRRREGPSPRSTESLYTTRRIDVPTTTPPPGSALKFVRAGALANRDFRILWSGVFLSMAANQMDTVARAWLAYHLSGSGTTLGLVSLARGLPQVALLLVAGAIADRVDKRKILVVSQASLATLGLLNAVLIYLGLIQVWHLAVIGLLQGAVFAFNGPTRHALIPVLVSAEQLPSAVAVTNTALHMNGVLAPVAAGVLIARSPDLAFFAIAAAYGGAALTLFGLPRRAQAAGARLAETLTAQMVDGYRYLTGHPQLRILIATAFVPIVVGMPFLNLLPIFQQDVLRVGPSSLGVMYTAAGLGSLASSLFFARVAGSAPKGGLLVATGTAFGLGVAAFALSKIYTLSVALLVVVGIASQAYLALNSLVIMTHANHEYYGRVMSIYMIAWALMPVAVFPLGAFVDATNPPLVVALMGLTVAVLTGTMARRARLDR